MTEDDGTHGHDTIEGELPDAEWRDQVHDIFENELHERALEAMYSEEFLRHWYRTAKDYLAHAAFPHLVGRSELHDVMLEIEDQTRGTFLAVWPIKDG